MKKILTALLALLLLTACQTNEQTSQTEATTPQASQEATTTIPELTVETLEILDEDVPLAEPEITIEMVASITDGDHDVSAQATIYSDGKLILENFYYDGAAPDVYVALGTKDDEGNFTLEQIISEKLEGAFENATFSVEIPLDVEFNAVSIWCDQYTEDFGSGIFS